MNFLEKRLSKEPMNDISTPELEDSVFFEVEDPETRKKYLIPDMSGNIDLMKAVQESVPRARKHGPEVRIAAAAMYVVLGNSRKVGHLLDVNPRIVRYWMHEPWWHIATREVRKHKNEELDSKLTQILEDTVEEISDRLANGEEVVNKNGEMVRIPVKTRDLATVMGITFDKRAILRADPVSKTEQTEVSEHLQKVAERLEKLVGKIPEPTIIEGEFKEFSSENGGEADAEKT